MLHVLHVYARIFLLKVASHINFHIIAYMCIYLHIRLNIHANTCIYVCKKLRNQYSCCCWQYMHVYASICTNISSWSTYMIIYEHTQYMHVYVCICMYLNIYACMILCLEGHSVCDIVYAHMCMNICPAQVNVCICMYMPYMHVYCKYMHVYTVMTPNNTGIDATSPNHSPSGHHQAGPTQGTPGHMASLFYSS